MLSCDHFYYIRPSPIAVFRMSSGSFATTLPFETLEIHKVFLRISKLDLQQNSALSC